MDEFGTVSHSDSSPVPDQLRGLFNHPDDVRVQKLPRAGLEDRGSMAVFFGAGARTVPHTHHHGQHLYISQGTGVVGDEKGVHGATPATAMTHLTVEQPGDFDLDVDRRDWDITYGPELGA